MDGLRKTLLKGENVIFRDAPYKGSEDIFFLLVTLKCVDGPGPVWSLRVGRVRHPGATALLPLRRHGEPLPHLRHSHPPLWGQVERRRHWWVFFYDYVSVIY